MAEPVENRLDSLEQSSTRQQEAITRIGTEVRSLRGWCTVHDGQARQYDVDLALLKRQGEQTEAAAEKLLTAQHAILEKLGALQARFVTQVIAAIGSALVVAAGAYWTWMVKQ